MQQIERYGVIALVFLLVTIVAISFWGDSKSPGFWSRLTGKSQPKQEQVAQIPEVQPTPTVSDVVDPNLPLSNPGGNGLNQPIPDVGQQPLQDPTNLPGTGARVGGNDPFVPIVHNGNDIVGGGDLLPSPGNGGLVNVPPPAPAPQPQPLPQPKPAASEYVVKSGDSLARIARTQLGAESRWQEIADLNPGVNPKALSIGQKLKLPAGARAAAAPTPKRADPKPTQAKPAVALKKDAPAKGSRSCTVKKGDTLSAIARRELGDERLWKDIVAVNPGLDPKRLAVGQTLRLPARAGAEQLAAAEKPAAVAVQASAKPRVQ